MCLIVRAQKSAHALADNSGLFTSRRMDRNKRYGARMSTPSPLRALSGRRVFESDALATTSQLLRGIYASISRVSSLNLDRFNVFFFKLILMCFMKYKLNLSYARLNNNPQMYIVSTLFIFIRIYLNASFRFMLC